MGREQSFEIVNLDFFPGLVRGRKLKIVNKKPKHHKHPSKDYCTHCRSQWPCEEAKEFDR